jgi:hypothetical protein
MNGRQFVYRYNGDATTDEVEVDAVGEMPVPEKGSIITRKGTFCKVVEVNSQFSTNRRGLPIHRVFLTNQS